jgi:hypothetical protein
MGIIKLVGYLFMYVAILMIIIRIVKAILEKIGVFGAIDRVFANKNENEAEFQDVEVNYFAADDEPEDDDEA